MISKLLAAWSLMAFCVVVHATGVTSALRWTRDRGGSQRFWRWIWLFILVAAWIILLHMIEITAWAAFYLWKDAIPDVQKALYFSAVTYTTTGYGDVVLPQQWQLVGGVEALTGILMCGWSTGFFFAVVSGLHERVAEERR
jgi:hypothetical protein